LYSPPKKKEPETQQANLGRGGSMGTAGGKATPSATAGASYEGSSTTVTIAALKKKTLIYYGYYFFCCFCCFVCVFPCFAIAILNSLNVERKTNGSDKPSNPRAQLLRLQLLMMLLSVLLLPLKAFSHEFSLML
jgi:hypothetical protein